MTSHLPLNDFGAESWGDGRLQGDPYVHGAHLSSSWRPVTLIHLLVGPWSGRFLGYWAVMGGLLLFGEVNGLIQSGEGREDDIQLLCYCHSLHLHFQRMSHK